MPFSNNVVVSAEDSDNTVIFDDIADTPLLFDQHMQDFSEDQFVTTINEGGIALHQLLQDSAALPSVSIGARTSLQGRVRRMSRAMAESVSQQEFYGRDKIYHMAPQTVCEHDYERLHDSHLDL